MTRAEQIEGKLKLICANCQVEKIVEGSVGERERKEFWNEHKTRIGKTYCHSAHIIIQAFPSLEPLEEQAVYDEIIGTPRFSVGKLWAREASQALCQRFGRPAALSEKWGKEKKE